MTNPITLEKYIEARNSLGPARRGGYTAEFKQNGNIIIFEKTVIQIKSILPPNENFHHDGFIENGTTLLSMFTGVFWVCQNRVIEWSEVIKDIIDNGMGYKHIAVTAQEYTDTPTIQNQLIAEIKEYGYSIRKCKFGEVQIRGTTIEIINTRSNFIFPGRIYDCALCQNTGEIFHDGTLNGGITGFYPCPKCRLGKNKNILDMPGKYDII